METAAGSFVAQLVSVFTTHSVELTVALLCVAAALAYIRVTSASRRTAGIPGELGWPLIHDDIRCYFKKGAGNHAAELTNKRRKLYGDVFRHRFLNEVGVTVGSLELVKRLFTGEGDTVASNLPASTMKMLGSQSMSMLHGKQHARMRKMTVPLFAPDAIRGYLPGIAQLMEVRLAGWATSEEPVLAYTEVKALTLDILMELVMGCSVADSMKGVYDGDPGELWKDFANGLMCLPISLPGTTYRRGLKARKVLEQVARQTLARIMQDAQCSDHSASAATTADAGSSGLGATPKPKQKFKSMGQMLVEARDEEDQSFTMQQMEDTCITFMFAGHDTTASTMLLLLKHLAAAPEVVQKLRAEQQAVVAQHGEAYTEAALKSMVYADATIQEAMRITPIVGAVPRTSLRDFEIGGVKIRKDTRVRMNLRMVLDDPAWRNLEADDPLAPTVFNPDRWQSEAISRLGLIAFGHGPHMCVGYPLALAELKVLLAVLARKYTWQLLHPDAEWAFFPVPRPKDGRMPIRMYPLQA